MAEMKKRKYTQIDLMNRIKAAVKAERAHLEKWIAEREQHIKEQVAQYDKTREAERKKVDEREEKLRDRESAVSSKERLIRLGDAFRTIMQESSEIENGTCVMCGKENCDIPGHKRSRRPKRFHPFMMMTDPYGHHGGW